MPFNINSFKQNVGNYGYLKNNSFEVFVSRPIVLQNTVLNNRGTPSSMVTLDRSLKFRIEQVRVPGITLLSSDINRYGVGPTQKMPFNAQFGETTFSVLVDGASEIPQFWHSWIRKIFEYNGTSSSTSGAANSFGRYVTQYKDQYASTMQIVIYDPYGNAIQKINLLEAFPSAVREIPLSWGDTQSLMRLAVNITYSEYTIEGSSMISAYGDQSSNIPLSAQLSRTQTITP